jgi:hypothetical protein
MTSRALFAQIRVAVVLGIFVNSGCSAPSGPSRAAAPLPGVPVAGAPPVTTGQPGAIKLDASFIEFQYGGSADWYYAPRLRASETSGVGAVVVTSARFNIPGFGGSWECGIGTRVGPGESRDLLPEIYGDYPLTFDHGKERTPGPVGLVLSLMDDSGRLESIAISFPVTPGSLPTTYTGDSGGKVFSCTPVN